MQACWQGWVGLQPVVLVLLGLLALKGQPHSAGFLALAEQAAVQTVEEPLEMAAFGRFVVLGQDVAAQCVRNASYLAALDGEQAWQLVC